MEESLFELLGELFHQLRFLHFVVTVEDRAVVVFAEFLDGAVKRVGC
jgi:hypothetical protein